MAVVRTSQTHPLQIAEVQAQPEQGRIGVTLCPGKHDPVATTGAWARDLEADLDVVQAWGARRVLSLIEHAELNLLKVPNLGEAVRARGLEWRHLPIADFSTPTPAFEEAWGVEGQEIRELLRAGESVLVHCRGGLGRAGMIAARLLVELGLPPQEAITRVRRVRPGAIETAAQRAVVQQTKAQP